MWRHHNASTNSSPDIERQGLVSFCEPWGFKSPSALSHIQTLPTASNSAYTCHGLPGQDLSVTTQLASSIDFLSHCFRGVKHEPPGCSSRQVCVYKRNRRAVEGRGCMFDLPYRVYLIGGEGQEKACDTGNEIRGTWWRQEGHTVSWGCVFDPHLLHVCSQALATIL